MKLNWISLCNRHPFRPRDRHECHSRSFPNLTSRTVNEFSLMLRTVKGLKYYFMCKLTSELPWFHGCWEKTWDSWIRGKGFSYLWNSEQHDHQHSFVTFPCPSSPTTEMEMSPMDACTNGGLRYSRGIPNFGTLIFFTMY